MRQQCDFDKLAVAASKILVSSPQGGDSQATWPLSTAAKNKRRLNSCPAVQTSGRAPQIERELFTLPWAKYCHDYYLWPTKSRKPSQSPKQPLERNKPLAVELEVHFNDFCLGSLETARLQLASSHANEQFEIWMLIIASKPGSIPNELYWMSSWMTKSEVFYKYLQILYIFFLNI